MADSKVSDGTNLTGGNISGDIFYTDRGGVDSYTTIDNFGVQGSFTATLTAVTPPTTPPTTTGYYTIVGNRVDLDIQFESVNTSGASGVLSITGLPASISASAWQFGPIWAFGIITITNYVPVVRVSGVTLYLRESEAVVDSDIVAGTGKYLRINMSYRI
jgi:hypothetical protein